MFTRHSPTVRLLVFQGEVLRLPANARELCVRDGLAWVAFAGRDYVLGVGQKVQLGRSRCAAVVSPINGPVVVEVTGVRSHLAPSIAAPFWPAGVSARSVS